MAAWIIGELVERRTASQATFGSGGAPCQMGFIDPVSGVSFALLTNGYPLAATTTVPPVATA